MPCMILCGSLRTAHRGQFCPSTMGHIGPKDDPEVLRLGSKAPLPAEPFYHLEKAFSFSLLQTRTDNPRLHSE